MAHWQRLGALWAKGKDKITGNISDGNGRKIWVSVVKNEKKEGKQPDFFIVAAPDAEWEVDEYEAKRRRERDESTPAEVTEDEIPF